MFKKFILVCSVIFFISSQLFYSAGALRAEEMETEFKIGQMLLLDIRMWGDESSEPIPVTEINSKTSELVEVLTKYHIGGIILFAENFESKEQIIKLIRALQEAAEKSGNPYFLITTDQEGGKVERFSFGRNKLKSNAEVRTPEEAFEKGKIIADELAELGINCNFAPVVDINSNPKNPVINVRSFGNDPEIVSKHGLAFVEGLHTHGIIATAKHFPGHGDTSTDSHLGLPLVKKSLSELEQCELIPFKSLIDAGVDMVMTAHIALPNIEKSTIISKKDGQKFFLPATLSKTILTGILRDELKFNGVILTDAMDMKAISEHFDEPGAIKMAIKAGADMICMPVTLRSASDIPKLDAVCQSLKSAIDSGEIPVEQINRSVNRILDLKSRRIKLPLEQLS